MGKIGSALGAILLMLSVVMVGVGTVQAAPIRAHLIVDAASGEVLSAQNPDATVYPASLTKMMTLYLLFESLHSGQLQLNDWLDVSQNAAMAKPTKLGLKAGSRITVKDAMLGLMTKSANDASVAIAEHLAGDVDSFARRMSFKAKKLGMNHTIYKNANGLPDPEQVTTARDIVTLSLALIRDFPEYYPYFSTEYFIYKGQKVANHNHLMSRYPGMDGIKTGYINASGFNLATSAVQKGKRIVGAIFGGTSAKARDHDMEKLLNASFAKLNGGTEAGGQMAEEDAKPTIKQSPALKEAVKKETETKDRTKLAALAEKHGTQEKKKGQAVAARDGDDDDWSVQIGAFKTRQAGEKALKVARRKSRTLKTKGVPKIEAMVRKGKTLYRVKFTGLASSEAKNVCKKIQECTPLPPNS